MRTNEKVPVVLALLFFMVPPTIHAQAQEGVREPVPHDHVISGSSLILLAGWFNAEYERKVAENLTVGITGGWIDLDEDDYTNVSGFVRFYPQEAAFTGFYLGSRAGVHNVDDGHDSHTALGIGVDVGDASSVIPSIRLLNVGVGF